MLYKGYVINYHQDIWGGVYAIYKSGSSNTPFHLAVNHFFNQRSAISYIDKISNQEVI